MQLSLPPTPDEEHCSLLIRRSLAVIRAATDDILSTVAANAYGFSQGQASQLMRTFEETEVLCRRCQHCLTQCSARATAAAAAVDMVPAASAEREQLAAEIRAATRHFHDVAAAARSAMSQLGRCTSWSARHGPALAWPHAAQTSQRASWDQLYALPATPRVGGRVEESSPEKVLSAGCNVGSSRRVLPAAAQRAVSPPGERSPAASAALALWRSRDEELFPSPPGAQAARQQQGESGSFAVAARALGPRRADERGGGGGGGGARGEAGGELAPRQLARRLQAELRRLQGCTAELGELLQGCVWQACSLRTRSAHAPHTLCTPSAHPLHACALGASALAHCSAARAAGLHDRGR